MRLIWWLLFLPALLMAQTEGTKEKTAPAKYGPLWIVAEINPKSFSWSDLGLERKESFTGPMIEAWMNWLTENYPGLVETVKICETDCRSVLENWEKKTAKELKGTLAEGYAGGLWLRIDLELEKLPADSAHSFHWEGRAVVVSIDSKKTLDAQVIWPEVKKWTGLDQKTLNSALASQVYRAPLGAFVRFKTALSQSTKTENTAGLLVRGHKHLGDVTALMNLLKTRGASLGLQVSLEGFSKDEARLRVYFKGEEKSFTDLLSQLKELKSSQDYVLVNDFTGVDHVLKLVNE